MTTDIQSIVEIVNQALNVNLEYQSHSKHWRGWYDCESDLFSLSVVLEYYEDAFPPEPFCVDVWINLDDSEGQRFVAGVRFSHASVKEELLSLKEIVKTKLIHNANCLLDVVQRLQ
jgi:hypothetical protein